MVHYGTATVMLELCRRHRRSLQIPALVFDASPGISGLLREVNFPAASILRLQIALLLLFIADTAPPPARIRTCAANTSGSYLGFWRESGALGAGGQFWGRVSSVCTTH